MVLVDVDVLMGAHGADKAFLDLEAGVVGMMEDAELGVPPFAVQVERAVGAAVEVHPPLHQLADLAGRFGDDLAHRLGVGEEVARHHSVVDMFVEIIDLQVGYGGHAPLRQGGVGLVEGCLAHQGHTRPFAGDLEGEAHAGDAAAYYEIVIFSNHTDTKFRRRAGCKFNIKPRILQINIGDYRRPAIGKQVFNLRCFCSGRQPRQRCRAA